MRPGMPILLPALLGKYLTCAFHVRHLSIITPRYLYSVACVRSGSGTVDDGLPSQVTWTLRIIRK